MKNRKRFINFQETSPAYTDFNSSFLLGNNLQLEATSSLSHEVLCIQQRSNNSNTPTPSKYPVVLYQYILDTGIAVQHPLYRVCKQKMIGCYRRWTKFHNRSKYSSNYLISRSLVATIGPSLASDNPAFSLPPPPAKRNETTELGGTNPSAGLVRNQNNSYISIKFSKKYLNYIFCKKCK